MIDPKDVTIIIPHLGGTPEAEYALDQCWQSLEETAKDIKKVLVINGKQCKVDRHDDWYTLYDVNQGQCRAVNAGVAITNTPWVMVTNDDMVYPPGWFEKLTSWVVNGRDLLCVSPRLVEPRPGAPTFATYFCGGAGGDFDKAKFFDYAKDYWGDGLQPGFNLPFLISRNLWDMVSGYDINFDPWGSNSDSDLEYKIRLAGVQPYQNRDCVVYHFSQTSGTFSPENRAAWEKNWAYFIEKWGFPRTDEGIWEATFEIPEPPVRKFTPEWEGKMEKTNTFYD